MLVAPSNRERQDLALDLLSPSKAASWRRLPEIVRSRRLVKLDRDYRFGSSRRVLVALVPPAGQADMRLDCYFCFPGRSGVVDA
jgi:hypothetical protein